MWLRAEHDLNMLLACRRVWFIVPARWERSKKDGTCVEMMANRCNPGWLQERETSFKDKRQLNEFVQSNGPVVDYLNSAIELPAQNTVGFTFFLYCIITASTYNTFVSSCTA